MLVNTGPVKARGTLIQKPHQVFGDAFQDPLLCATRLRIDATIHSHLSDVSQLLHQHGILHQECFTKHLLVACLILLHGKILLAETIREFFSKHLSKLVFFAGRWLCRFYVWHILWHLCRPCIIRLTHGGSCRCCLSRLYRIFGDKESKGEVFIVHIAILYDGAENPHHLLRRDFRFYMPCIAYRHSIMHIVGFE